MLVGTLFFTYRTPTSVSYADGLPQEEIVKYEIPAMVTYYATQYGVSQELAHYMAKNESQYNPLETGDLTITCHENNQYKGKPVYARGVYQITRCYYPKVTDAQAFDPAYNIQFAMNIISKGKDDCINQFSTCRDYYKRT